MGNAVVFGKAFKECGVGGRFSKFQIIQAGEWFELINVAAMEDSRFCLKSYDRLNHKAFRKVEAHEAYKLHSEDPQWQSNLNVAERAIKKIIKSSNNKAETRWYIDDFNKSVFLINRMFVIEVTPKYREVVDIPSHAVFSWLDQNVPGYQEKSVVRLLTHFGRVKIFIGAQEYNTMLTPEEFNQLFGE